MKWFDYKKEVDALHASDALKARLLAMEAADAPQPAPAKPRRAIAWRRALPLAACFALGVVCCAAVGGGLASASANELFSTRSSGSAQSAAAVAEAYDMGESAENATADMAAGAAETDTQAGVAVAAVAAETAGQNKQSTTRKVIYNAELTVETKAYDDTRAALEKAAAAAGGYAESSSEYAYSTNARSWEVVYRIPADQYSAFLAAAGDSGSVVRHSENAQDITASYIDVQARVTALTTQRDALLTLESQAETLEDLLVIQDQLTDVQYQLDSYQSQLNYYDDQVDYCTVTIYLEEVQTYTPVEQGFLARLGAAFTQAVGNFGAALGGAVIWLVGGWPWLVLLAAAAALVVLAVRRRKKRGAGK